MQVLVRYLVIFLRPSVAQIIINVERCWRNGQNGFLMTKEQIKLIEIINSNRRDSRMVVPRTGGDGTEAAGADLLSDGEWACSSRFSSERACLSAVELILAGMQQVCRWSTTSTSTYSRYGALSLELSTTANSGGMRTCTHNNQQAISAPAFLHNLTFG